MFRLSTAPKKTTTNSQIYCDDVIPFRQLNRMCNNNEKKFRGKIYIEESKKNKVLFNNRKNGCTQKNICRNDASICSVRV